MKRILPIVLTLLLTFTLSSCQKDKQSVGDLSLSPTESKPTEEQVLDESKLDFKLVKSSLDEPAHLGDWVKSETEKGDICLRATEVTADKSIAEEALEKVNNGTARVYNLPGYDLKGDLEFAVLTYEIFVPENFAAEDGGKAEIKSPLMKLILPDGKEPNIRYGGMTFPVEGTVMCKPGETAIMHSLFIREKASSDYIITDGLFWISTEK